ncbi:DNA cytosine methyltransferase [Klenkia taihuensis]|uniref:DNA (cytosine-5-)-methyltransferase n=1 Tax=Klenkia taihuensis TaxID=1225127 RepID=A0A1I1IDQ5_9ACTN|nr:DNA cytosine methyltransferase [Klenkia taihuensis]GHE08703.1 restriction endonuclease subunit M [Klenkia taihuensis]SFC33822.1 DNA (cytosine-5)-methyltransferase 1 [Klenkia taihuensis]
MSAGQSITAIDLFCGAGGLSEGLRQAGIPVAGGIDVDPACSYPFEVNIEAPFLEQDVRDVTAAQLNRIWQPGAVRVLAGCAPCQPFSPYRRGVDTTSEEQWPLLAEFGRLVADTRPEVVTMENVPRIGNAGVFTEFVEGLRAAGYSVDWRSCNGLHYGLPQGRRRLVLLASLLGPLKVPDGPLRHRAPRTVRDTIGELPAVVAGGVDAADPLHKARALTEVNIRRLQASKPGGSWQDWPEELRAPCHRKASGSTFRNVYARMEWDKPSPTITTMAYNYGTGRFGHPDQDRALTLREAAMLQGFPQDYQFVREGGDARFNHLGRLIGNAVPPPIAAAVGAAIVEHVALHTAGRQADAP